MHHDGGQAAHAGNDDGDQHRPSRNARRRLPANGTSVSARAMPIDTAVAAITSDTTSATVVTTTARSANSCRLTRSFDQFVGHVLIRVRIILVINMAADAGAVRPD